MEDQIKVVILCGGIGTRLREETEFRPKPMVNIGSRPILWHIMKYYSQFGCRDFILALGYKGEMIKNYFCHYELMNNDVTIELGHPEKMCIHYSHDEDGWRITLADTGEKSLKGSRLPNYRCLAPCTIKVYRPKKKRIPLPDLVKRVSETLKVDQGDLCSGDRKSQVSKARSVISYVAVREMGYSGVEVGRILNLSGPGVTKSAEKEKRIISADESLRRKLIS